MFELLFLVMILIAGVLVLKLVFGILGFAFHLVVLPIKIVLGLVFGLLLLPLLLLFLPVVVVGAISLALVVVGGVLMLLFGILAWSRRIDSTKVSRWGARGCGRPFLCGGWAFRAHRNRVIGARGPARNAHASSDGR